MRPLGRPVTTHPNRSVPRRAQKDHSQTESYRERIPPPVFIPVGRRVPNTKWIRPRALPPAISADVLFSLPRASWPARALCLPRGATGGRPSPPPLATAPCRPMQRDTAGAAPASLCAAGRRPKRPLPSGDPTPRRSRARRECGARAISVPGHAGRSDMGSQTQNSTLNSESAAAAPPPAAGPLTETNSVPPFSPPPPPPPPRPSPPSPPPSISRRRPSDGAGPSLAGASPLPPSPLAAAPLVAAASPVSIPLSAPPLPPPRASPQPPPPSPSPLSGAWRASHRPGRGAHSLCTLSPSLYSDCAAGAATHAVRCLGQRREPRGGPPLTALSRRARGGAGGEGGTLHTHGPWHSSSKC